MDMTDWQWPTVDTPDTERNDLLPRYRPTRRPMTAVEFQAISDSHPLAILPWILVPDGLGDFAPPVMHYAIDFVPDQLVAYAEENDSLVVYYDESPACSEFDSDGDNEEVEQEEHHEQDEPREEPECKLNAGQEQDEQREEPDSERSAGQGQEREQRGESDLEHGKEGEEDSESEEEDYDFRRLKTRNAPRRKAPTIDRIGSMRCALRALAIEAGAHIHTRLLKISLGIQRMGVRETSLIISFYSNYDLKAGDLPTTEDIEKLRVAVGSQHPPGWYLDRSNYRWERYY
ncbi:uncharacterized protein C8Q71DRAFT_721503 [Rhodofomes roseus]|uniref:Uncharacterized protein n=1 Tax=Rhodofomes roseus TaxID=34475 RepID=A0ABQ8KS28_9APHY|nr:uncharacterized protein C8Q71DRAFT_721503 [Rhodofomes roseus]KAH9841094.1 hypothetical protein C8Q71DRAFT_721503 [Rhodofomes roseus]